MGGRAVGTGGTRLLGFWQLVVLTVLLWLAFVRPTEPAANANLDPSWGAVQAFVLRGGAQCGVDTVFTLGPLGWFNNPTYVAELFGVHLLWEIAFKLLAASLVVAVLAQLRNGWDFALGFGAALCAGAEPDGFAFVALFANAVWIARRREHSLAWSILSMAPSVVLAMVKFPYFIAFVANTIALAVLLWPSGRRRATAFVAGVIVLFVLAWRATGQSPANLPAWIETSFAIARGYGAALGTDSPRAQLALALLMLAASAFALRFALRCDQTPGHTVFVLLFAFTAWLAFKNGFVRGQHKPLALFDFAGVALFAMPIEGLVTARAARTLRRVASVVALGGHALVVGVAWDAPRALVVEVAERIGESVAFLARPGGVRAELETDLAAKRLECGLPRVRERVGRDTIDVFGCSQGVAFLNDLAYRPRPVFQGYAAYTAELQDMNRRFFESERAPQWVLFGFRALDDHLPPIEDAAAFAVISRDYALDLEERGYLLLKHRDPSARTRDIGSVVISEPARFGDRIDLTRLSSMMGREPRALTLALDVRLTPAGSLGMALVAIPTLALEVEDARGRRRTWRIAPGYVSGGFVISPLLDTPERYRGWFHGDMELSTRAVRVLVADEDRWAFDDAFRFELGSREWMAPPVEPDYAARRLAAIVRPAPTAIETRAGYEMAMLRAETEVLVVGTPSSMRFDLGAGRFELTAYCGLHPRLADKSANGGASFLVVVREANGTEREIERRVVAPDRGLGALRWNLALDLADKSSVFLRTEGADPSGMEAVNAFWALVSIEREP